MPEHKFTNEERQLLIGYAAGLHALSRTNALIGSTFIPKGNLAVQFTAKNGQLTAFAYRRNMVTGSLTDEIELPLLVSDVE